MISDAFAGRLGRRISGHPFERLDRDGVGKRPAGARTAGAILAGGERAGVPAGGHWVVDDVPGHRPAEHREHAGGYHGSVDPDLCYPDLCTAIPEDRRGQPGAKLSFPAAAADETRGEYR